MFLLGALFTEIQNDIFAPAWVLGTAVAAYWAAAAIVSSNAGRIVNALGLRWSNSFALGLAVLSLVGSAVFLPGWSWLLPWAIVGGAGNGIGHPPSNSLIGRQVSGKRHGAAFGIKQAAVPFCTVLAGITVPISAVIVGWHWAFWLAALFVLVVIVMMLIFGRSPDTRDTTLRTNHVKLSTPLMRYLLHLACVTTLGAAAAGAVASYAVTEAVSRGVDVAWAGILLSTAGLLCASNRVISGWLADRTHGRFALITASGMLTVGGLGVLLMSLSTEWTFIVGMIAALGIGWGWPGLTHFVVSKAAGPATPSATGIVQTGSYIGSAGGPLLFGLLFTSLDTACLWVIVGAIQILAAGLALILFYRRTPHMQSAVSRPSELAPPASSWT